MTEKQKSQLANNNETSLYEKFKAIVAFCTENGVYHQEKAREYIKVISDSASDLVISNVGRKEGAYFITNNGERYKMGTNDTERFGYYLYLLHEYDAYEHNLVIEEGAKAESITKQDAHPPEEENSINILCVADVEKKSVSFLIEPYLVKNNVNILAGDGGVGKTFVWGDIASAITNGKAPSFLGVPESLNKPPNNIASVNAAGNRRVLYFSSEDSTAITLKGRFEAAGADLDQLCFVSSEDESFHKINLDSSELEECIALVRPALVILDPLQSFVHGKMSERNNMRKQMDCLTALAQRYDTTFLLVVHTNKLQTTDARTKLSDSSDIWDKCRSVMFVGRTKDGLRYLSQEKGNYTTDENRLDTQLFTIKDNHIVHKGTTEKKFFDFATESAFSGRDSTQRDNAKEFILTSLKDGEMLVKDLDTSAESFGISRSTFKRAKTELNESNKIKYRKEGQGKDKGVVWYISLNTVSNESSE